MKTIGLTGGIGSGKTTVANFFKALGAPVFIADIEAKKLMDESSEVRTAIREIFGERAYISDILDRKFIASIVFSDKTKLAALNKIVHPAVRRHFENWREQQTFPYVIYEAAILFETGSHTFCDFTIVVTANHQMKIERLVQRDQSTLAEIEARMDNQWPDEKRIPLADFVIENTQLDETQKMVKEIHQTLLETA